MLLVSGWGDYRGSEGLLTWVLAGGGAELLVDGGVLLELRSDVAAVCPCQRRAAVAMAAYGALHQRVNGGDACQLTVGHLVVGGRGGELVLGGRGA